MYSYIERQNHCGYNKEPELLAKFGEFEHIADINLPNAIPMTQIVRLCPSRAIYSVCVHLLDSSGFLSGGGRGHLPPLGFGLPPLGYAEISILHVNLFKRL